MPNIGTHIVNNLIGLAGNVRRVTASSLTGGRPSTPQDAVAAPDMSASSGSIVVGEHLTATLEFDGGATCTMLQHRFPQVDSAPHTSPSSLGRFSVFSRSLSEFNDDQRTLGICS